MSKQSSNKFKAVFATIFWTLFLLAVVSVGTIFTAIAQGNSTLTNLGIVRIPDLEELQNPKNSNASLLYSADNQVLGAYYRHENRVSVPYRDISPYMINALVATEDARFYEHAGVDSKSLLRAIIFLGKKGGGSTITQQLAKLQYTPQANNIFVRAMQKPTEWVIAAQLERLYSKEEIITMYLNQFDFLHNAVGIKQAAQVYFNTTPADLKLEEAAMLVGMFKNPAVYNPVRHPERTLQRRNVVLSQMAKYGYITEAERDSVSQLPLGLNYRSVDHKQGPAPYVREYLRIVLTAKEPQESDYPSWNKAQYAIDKEQWDNNPLYGFCNKNTKPDGTHYDLYEDGLRIYTTIDSRMQRYAEEAVSEHMQYLQKQFFKEKKNKSYAPFSRDLKKDEIDGIMRRSMKQSYRYISMKKEGRTEQEIVAAFNEPTEMRVFTYEGMVDTVMTPLDSIRYLKYFLRCGFMSMDAHNGHVKAYVGGPNFTNFQYDMATKGRRQVGSTVKPFLYTLAMNEGMCPGDKTVYEPITLIDGNGKEWTPRGAKHGNVVQGDTVTIKWGLQNSDNWITAYLMSIYTPEQLARLMHSFGITGQIDPVVSLCLGPCEVSVAEMVSAYTAFPNKGERFDPLFVTRIEDRNGVEIASFSKRQHEVIDETTSYKMVDMLRGVIDHGTGVRLRYKYNLTAPIGGKTGTTQNNSDGWFMGFTPSLVNGCWVGGEDRAIHFDNMAEGQGASMALPIWAIYMQKVYGDKTLNYSQDEQFDIPADFDPNAACQ